MEGLEERLLMANVLAVVSHGTLTLTGDSDPNQVAITRNGADPVGTLRITGTGSTINGSSAADQPFAGVKKIVVKLAGGDDDLELTNLTVDQFTILDSGGRMTLVATGVVVNRSVGIRTVSGGSEVTFQGACRVGGALTVRNGTGDDTLAIYGATDIAGAVRVNNGTGDSYLRIAGSSLHKGLSSTSTEGIYSDILQSMAITGNLTLKNGDGGGQVIIDTPSITGNLTLTAKTGNDDVEIIGGTITGNMKVSNGPGPSTVYIITTPATIGGNLTVNGNDSDEYVSLLWLTLGGRFIYNAGNGTNALLLDDSTLAKGASYVGGSGADNLFIEGRTNAGNTTFGGPVGMRLGDGNDQLWIGGATQPEMHAIFHKSLTLDGGKGTFDTANVYRTLGYNTFDLPPVLKHFETIV